MAGLDGWQRRTRWAGVPYGTVKKFSDDNANLLVVSLAWYGFTAIFPLLLVVVTLFGFIGQRSICSGIISTLHEFPVVGSSSNPASRSVLPGGALGLVIGLIGLVYGAQGVTQTAQQAMATVWNIPTVVRTVGGNTIIANTLTGSIAGSFTGTFTADFTTIAHSAGQANDVHGTFTCTCSIAGRSGSVTFRFEGTGTPAATQLHAETIGATGGLAGLHSTVTVDIVGAAATYSGTAHFDS